MVSVLADFAGYVNNYHAAGGASAGTAGTVDTAGTAGSVVVVAVVDTAGTGKIAVSLEQNALYLVAAVWLLGVVAAMLEIEASEIQEEHAKK